MDLELRIAVEFLLSFVVKKFKGTDTEGFIETLLKNLAEKFKGHWYPEKPNKGSGYRCISLFDQLDTVLISAAEESGFDVKLLRLSLPTRLDVWIDPKEISYRIGEYGSVTQIYRQGDDELNSKSEYAMAIMKNFPAATADKKNSGDKSSAGTKQSQRAPGKELKSKSESAVTLSQAQTRKRQAKDPNRLSPTARSFVSRGSPPLPLQVAHSHSVANTMYAPKPVSSWDYARKPFWQPVPMYDPIVNMHAHNFILAHEIARFEAHMKAQRIALQTHYYKSSFQAPRRVPAQYLRPHVPAETAQNNGLMRVQVVV